MLKIELFSKHTFRKIGPYLWFDAAIIRCRDCGAYRPTPSTASFSADMTWIGRPTDEQIEAWVHNGTECVPVADD